MTPLHVRLRAVAAAAALLATPFAGPAAARERPPCPDLLSPRRAPPAALAQTLERLRRAVAARDAATLRAIAAPDIRTSFGGDTGLEALRPDDPAAPVWARLARALAFGCADAGHGGAWACPGLPSDGPAARGLDPFDQVFVLGAQVRVRAAPAPDAAVLAMVSCRVLRRDPEGERRLPTPATEDVDPDWVPVALPDGRRGFVAARLAHSPVGHRAVFERRGGAWWMTHFLAGD